MLAGVFVITTDCSVQPLSLQSDNEIFITRKPSLSQDTD